MLRPLFDGWEEGLNGTTVVWNSGDKAILNIIEKIVSACKYRL